MIEPIEVKENRPSLRFFGDSLCEALERAGEGGSEGWVGVL